MCVCVSMQTTLHLRQCHQPLSLLCVTILFAMQFNYNEMFLLGGGGVCSVFQKPLPPRKIWRLPLKGNEYDSIFWIIWNRYSSTTLLLLPRPPQMQIWPCVCLRVCVCVCGGWGNTFVTQTQLVSTPLLAGCAQCASRAAGLNEPPHSYKLNSARTRMWRVFSALTRVRIANDLLTRDETDLDHSSVGHRRVVVRGLFCCLSLIARTVCRELTLRIKLDDSVQMIQVEWKQSQESECNRRLSSAAC